MRASIRFGLMLAGLIVGLLIELLVFPFLPVAGRETCIRVWSRYCLRCCGVRFIETGKRPNAPTLIAANHASWLDILTINSMQASQFVAKAEIRAWPVVGLLVARAGTHFIERSKRRAVHDVLQSLVKALRAGRVVAVFPEGTTNDGKQLKPFHANLIQAALDAQVTVTPLAIRYENGQGQLSEAIEYVGDTTFVASMWRILGLPGIVAQLSWGESQAPVGNRHELCKLVEGQISRLSGLPKTMPSSNLGNVGLV